MNLADARLKELDDPSLTLNERVLLRCRLASEFIHTGHYESACEALGELWQGVGRRPEVEKLKLPTAAEVLLQCGVLSGWLGRVQHISGAQEQAKDLLSEALRMFQSQRQPVKASEAQYELGMCYFRLGAYDAARVIQAFEKGSDYALLADALTLRGVVRARLGEHESSIRTLRHAMSVAQDSGAFSNAGLAALTLIEEHGLERLSATKLFDIYRRADELLKDTQDLEEIARLRACARIMGRRLIDTRLSDKGFRLTDVVLAYEAKFIREALEAEQGIITRAAKRLGLRHQSLSHILKTRHKHLLNLRTPAKTRKRSITHPRAKQSQHIAEKQTRPAIILYVEDNKLVADAVRDTLEAERRRVVTCGDGSEALKMLTGEDRYDLLLFDNELPHVNGIELIRHTRQLPHRRRVPVIMLSASDVETDAWRAWMLALPAHVVALDCTSL